MAYSDFTIESALRAFELTLDEPGHLFEAVPALPLDPAWLATVTENAELATAIHTAKARSELIVAPVLLEVRRLLDRQIGFFSGVGFDVDPGRGLTGVCDFLPARSPSQIVMNAPVLAVVEAKDDNIRSGLGQCIARWWPLRSSTTAPDEPSR